MSEVKNSGTVSIYSKVLEKKLKGETVYNFSAGDVILKNHPVITSAASEFIHNEAITYPTSQGDSRLRQKVAEWLNESCQTSYDLTEVIVTPGGKYALYTLLFTLLSPNDEVLICSPYWVSYPELVRMNGGISKIIKTKKDENWKLFPKMIRDNLSSRTKFLIFNNGCNPTGTIYSREEVKAILETAKEAGLIVLSDEVYSGLVYEDTYTSCGTFEEHKEHLFIIQSCSKNFAMSGWRVGFGIGPAHTIQKTIPFLSQTTTGVSTVSQQAALAAITHFKDVNAYVKSTMESRRTIFFDTLNHLFSLELEKSPSAIYSFVSLHELGVKHTDSVKFCMDAMNKENVALTPGIYFGQEGYVRFAFSDLPENMTSGLTALKKMC